MPEPKKVVPCPSCRFGNRLGDARCLLCKTALPETVAPRAVAPTTARPRVPGSADPSDAPRPAPQSTRLRRVDPAAEVVAWVCCQPLPPLPLVSGKQLVVGRVDACDLVLPHKEVSRSHAVFKVVGRQIILEDQGSSNGCFVNGKRRASTSCKVGDVIQIGPYEIELRATPEQGSVEDGSSTATLEVTRFATGARNASMTGQLSEVPLVEILQQIEFNSKTCTLAISDGRLKGEIVFGAGAPLRARFGSEEGLPAARAMLRLREGRFVLSSEVEPGEATLSITVTGLLLDASREIDEAARGSEPAPPDPPPEE